MNAAALRTRTAEAAAGRQVVVIEGDTNANIDTILNHIPERSLTFCFVDPFAIGPLQFSTIKRLAEARRMDFLVLLATGMDVTRNERLYTRTDDSPVSEALGHDEWRARWPQPRIGFGDFVADEFGKSMTRLGYHYNGLADTRRSTTAKTLRFTGSRFSAGILWGTIFGRSAGGPQTRTGGCSDGEHR